MTSHSYALGEESLTVQEGGRSFLRARDVPEERPGASWPPWKAGARQSRPAFPTCRRDLCTGSQRESWRPLSAEKRWAGLQKGLL